jgi:uncharacterized membrane protein HdeD (DUF308 family)
MTAPVAASSAPAPLTDDLKMPRWWIPVVVGVLGIIVGFLALVWPGPTLLVVGVLFGIYLVMAGFGDLMAAFSHETSSAFVRVLYGLLGVLTVGVGFVLLVRPGASVVLAAFTLGIWFLVSGCLQLAQGIAVRESRVWNLILGVIGIVAGGLIVAQPSIGVVTLVYIVSISLVLRGVASIVLGFGLKAADKLITEGAA